MCIRDSADGGNIEPDIVHGVVNRHAGGDGTAGAVDIQMDVLIWILAFQIQKLRNHQAGRSGIHFIGQHNNTCLLYTSRCV